MSTSCSETKEMPWSMYSCVCLLHCKLLLANNAYHVLHVVAVGLQAMKAFLACSYHIQAQGLPAHPMVIMSSLWLLACIMQGISMPCHAMPAMSCHVMSCHALPCHGCHALAYWHDSWASWALSSSWHACWWAQKEILSSKTCSSCHSHAMARNEPI